MSGGSAVRGGDFWFGYFSGVPYVFGFVFVRFLWGWVEGAVSIPYLPVFSSYVPKVPLRRSRRKFLPSLCCEGASCRMRASTFQTSLLLSGSI